MTENPQDQPVEGGQTQQPSQPPPPPPPAPGPVYGQQVQAPVSPSDARMWAMFAHLGGILFYFVPSLVIYLIYKDRDPFVRSHALQALNFQIIATIAYAVSWVLTLVFIGVLTGLATFICVVVFSIIAGIAANKGQEYTYPYIPQMVT